MKRLTIILLILTACVNVDEKATAVIEQKSTVQQAANESTAEITEKSAETVTRTVRQTGSLGTFVYELNDDNKIISIEKTGEKWEYAYENNRLTEIKGPKNIEFLYEKNRLAAIDTGAQKLLLDYDALGRLLEAKGYKETLRFDYNSNNRLTGVRRGAVAAANIDYDKKGMIKQLKRGNVPTSVYFDDKGRIRNFDSDEIKLILGYWRDGRLISLTGKAFGNGLTVSYGPGYPPREAEVISTEDNSRFTTDNTETLYKVVDEYLYCKYVRRLKELLFESNSYAFYTNYFRQELPEYIAMQFACQPYET